MSRPRTLLPRTSAPARRRANLALLVLLPLAVVSGFACFVVGGGSTTVVVVAHGVVGLAIAVLTPWKQAVVRRGLPRPRAGRGVSVLLMVLVVAALLTGVAHATGLARTSPWVSALQLHVAAGLVALVPLVLHVRHRQRVRRSDPSRRDVLRGAAVLAGAGALYGALAGATWLFGWPGADRRPTGSFERSSGVPEGLPPTIWLLDEVPVVDPATFRLTVVAAGTTRQVALADLPTARRQATVLLDCTGGWYSWQTWAGVPVAALLPAGATGSVRVVSRTGYARRLPLTDDLLLATHLGDDPLTAEHGAPLRLVVPGRRGYHWVKWVDRVEHHPDVPWWVQPPLPLSL